MQQPQVSFDQPSSSSSSSHESVDPVWGRRRGRRRFHRRRTRAAKGERAHAHLGRRVAETAPSRRAAAAAAAEGRDDSDAVGEQEGDDAEEEAIGGDRAMDMDGPVVRAIRNRPAALGKACPERFHVGPSCAALHKRTLTRRRERNVRTPAESRKPSAPASASNGPYMREEQARNPAILHQRNATDNNRAWVSKRKPDVGGAPGVTRGYRSRKRVAGADGGQETAQPTVWLLVFESVEATLKEAPRRRPNAGGTSLEMGPWRAVRQLAFGCVSRDE